MSKSQGQNVAPRANVFRPNPAKSVKPIATNITEIANQDAINLMAMDLLKHGLLRANAMKPSQISAQYLHGDRSKFRTPLIAAQDLSRAAARHLGTSTLPNPVTDLDHRLIDRLGVSQCLRMGLLPWRRAGDVTIIASANPAEFTAQRSHLEKIFGPVAMVSAQTQQIETTLRDARGALLARRAETRVAADQSCRSWQLKSHYKPLILITLSVLAFSLYAPYAAIFTLFGLTFLNLILVSLLKLVACLASLRRSKADTGHIVLPDSLPRVSLIVALYRESDIAQRLIRRLSRLDYPREFLEILLVIEADDTMTQAALEQAQLPHWMRIVIAPAGQIKTKPRALNIALDHARGDIIGVYDAEDAPDSDQIRKVVSQFHQAPTNVVCIQGVLDYYNPTTNWIARCFTFEYATWFRLWLPGVAQLRLMVPLGGTTLFFRRTVLEKLGAWDAYNVTEDADLGIRLHRHGYRTQISTTTTLEEANCRPLAWIKQRSRWIKGYMMTWLVHMRAPHRLVQDIGWRAFWGFQVMFLGSFSQALLAPILWGFWLLSLGSLTSLPQLLPNGLIHAAIAVLMTSSAIDISLYIKAIKLRRHKINPLWALSLPLYGTLATFAAYKALWEVITRPFYWDKTHHGLFDPHEAASTNTRAKQSGISPSADLALASVSLAHPPRPSTLFQKRGSNGFLTPHKLRLHPVP